MKDTQEESIKAFSIGRLPLAEAMTHINSPLYGLTEEVLGLQYTRHGWNSENSMGLYYLSPRYKEYRFRDNQTLWVLTHLFGEDENVAFFGGGTNMIEAGCIMLKYCP